MDIDDNKDKKTDNVNSIVNTTFMSQSIIYTIVEEALWAHSVKDFLNMFDCVNTLYYFLKDLPSKSNTTFKVISKRLHPLMESIDIEDCDGMSVKVHTYDLLRSIEFYSGYTGKYAVPLVDCNNNNVYAYVHELFIHGDYIGRVLMITLFDLLLSKDIYLPRELYIKRHRMETDE